MTKEGTQQSVDSEIMESWTEDDFMRIINAPENRAYSDVDFHSFSNAQIASLLNHCSDRGVYDLFYSLTGAQIASLLSRCTHPEIISLCDLGRLSDTDWQTVITAQPKMKKYWKRCQMVAPPGNAALGVADSGDKEKIIIPKELIKEAESIADEPLCYDMLYYNKHNEIFAYNGFDKSCFCGCVSGNDDDFPLLFIFADSQYDIDTLVKLVRRVIQMKGKEWSEELGCFPFAVIKNFETYSTMKSRKTNKGIVKLVGDYFSDWSMLERNYPELDGITMFHYGTEMIIEQIFKKKTIIEKWMAAQSRLPRHILFYNNPFKISDIAWMMLQKYFPTLIAYRKLTQMWMFGGDNEWVASQKDKRQSTLLEILESMDNFEKIRNDPTNATDADFYSLDGDQIAWLLRVYFHPEIISISNYRSLRSQIIALCHWRRLSDANWETIIKIQPKMKKYWKRCQMVAPPGNAALGVADSGDKEKIIIPKELVKEAESIAEILDCCFGRSRACFGFAKSRFCGYVRGQKSSPLLFAFSNSEYDIDTLVRFIRRAMQITIEKDWTDGLGLGREFCYPFAVIKNFETYSTIRSWKRKDGSIKLVGGYFDDWGTLEHNYPELDGITLFHGKNKKVMQEVLEKKATIEKWMAAQSRLPRLIPLNDASFERQSVEMKTLYREFPELMSYRMEIQK